MKTTDDNLPLTGTSIAIKTRYFYAFLLFLCAISFLNAAPVIDKPLRLSNTQYAQTLIYNANTFNQPVILSELTFMQDLIFNWVTFNESSDFYRVTINGQGAFYFSSFKNKTHFNKLRCNNACLFVHSVFNTLELTRSIFSDTASLHGSHLQEAFINQCLFEKLANFSHMHIEKTLAFNNSSFLNGLNLSETTLNGPITFNNTTILKFIDLSFLHTTEEIIDLTTVNGDQNNQPIAINLLGTDLKKIKLNYLYFDLFFQTGINDSEKEKIYNGLLDNFKRAGDTASYKKMLAEYRHYQNIRDKFFIKDFVAKYWWHYSTHPEWIFLWMLSFIILYTLINAIFYDKLSSHYFNLPFLTNTKYPYAVKKYLIIRMIYSLPRAFLFTLIMFFGTQFRMLNGLQEFKSNNIFVNLYFIIMMTTGMLCMFFLIRYLFAQISL